MKIFNQFFSYFSGSREISRHYQIPTTSRTQPMMTTMAVTGGTKSLTNSPLLVGKTRRGGPSSVMHGNMVYNGNDRHSNIYGLQPQPTSLNHDNSYLLNVPNQSINSNTSHLMAMPRDRRLSGSQQPGVRVHY